MRRLMGRRRPWFSVGWRGVGLVSVVCGFIALMPAVTSAATTEQAVFMAGDNFDVYRANLDGSGLDRLTSCGTDWNDCIYYWPMLSPDGQTVALESGWPSITLMGIDGSHKRVLINDPTHTATFPAWAPDGRSILFTRRTTESDGTVDEDLYSISTVDERFGTSDGSNATPVITGPGDQEAGDYSPDGTQIVYDGNDGAGKNYGIWIANRDGTNRQELDLGALNQGNAISPTFSPDGRQIAFTARIGSWPKPYGLYVINSDGSGLHQVIDDGGDYYSPTWTSTGQILVNRMKCCDPEHIGLVDPTSSSPTFQPLINPPYPDFGSYPETYSQGEDIGSTRKPSAWFGTDQVLATRFRPVLLFDSQEPWRPLDINAFMSEQDPTSNGSYNKVCEVGADPSTCQNLDSNWQSELDSFTANNPDPFLSVGHTSSDSSGYQSPDPACVNGTVLDCNQGPASAIYYHTWPTDPTSTTTTPGGYRYIDYWINYRYNHFPEDDHEGDWEGLTVGYNPATPDSFSFVGYAQHNSAPAWYLPADLTCGAQQAACDYAGAREDAFVAQGSHATYPASCDGHVLPISTCQQSGFLGLIEGSHDGAALWGNDDNPPGAVQPLPSAQGWSLAGGNWVDWPGHWGSTCADQNFSCSILGESVGNSPSSPDSSGHPRYTCPADGNSDWDPGACPSRASRSGDPFASAGLCGSWFGADVVSLVCSPSGLGHAIRHRALKSGWSAHARLAGCRTKAGVAYGLIQTVGGAGCSSISMTITGKLPSDTLVGLRVQRPGWVANFGAVPIGGLGGRVRILVQVSAAGRAELRILSRGRVVRDLHRRATRVRSTHAIFRPSFQRAPQRHARGMLTPAQLPASERSCIVNSSRIERKEQLTHPDEFRKLLRSGKC